MENTLNEKVETIKKNINGISGKSKETIREIIATNSRYAEQAIDANGKVFEKIKENLAQNGMENTIIEDLKHSLVKSVEMAEDTLDAIVNAYTRQVELTVDFDTKLIDAVKESNPENAEKLLQLIVDNLEHTCNLADKNTKEILEFYNKHTNLAVNFNKRFVENVNIQLDTLMQIQNKSFGKFTEWVSVWWKQDEAKKENA